MSCRWTVVPLVFLAVSAVGDDWPDIDSKPPRRCVAASPKPQPLPVTAAEVRPHIEHLASEELCGRSGEAALAAAQYIRAQFEQIGLQPLFAEGSFLQPIAGRQDETEHRPIIGQNVGGWVCGSDPALRNEFIIISAHYDHLGVRDGEIYPGADDNASGVSMLLETARELAALEEKPRRSVAFVGFDLEERMLWGSRWFASHPPWELERVKLFITADMIGRSLGDLPLPTVFVLGSERAPMLKGVLANVTIPDGLEVARLGADLIGTRSDYGPFRDREIPFLFFSTGEHPDYHTPFDRPERIDYQKVSRVSTLILRVALEVANSDDAPQWTDIVALDLDDVRAVYRITQLLLEADDRETSLNGLQRLFISQVHARTGNVLELGRITAAERRWLVRAAQLLMLSVF